MVANNSSTLATIFRSEIPRLDGINYRIWKIHIETHLIFLGKEIWGVTNKGYVPYDSKNGNPPPTSRQGFGK